MRVHHVTTYAGIGGAGIAAQRLVQGLRRQAVDARMFCVRASEGAEAVTQVRFGASLREKLWRRLRVWQLGRMRRRYQPRPPGAQAFFLDLSCYGMALLEACRGADVLHLHWVCDLLDYPYILPRLPREVPVVWTLHDMNPATGGCFYTMDCTRFHSVCGGCPQLGSDQRRDLSTEVWQRKADALKRLQPLLTVVTPSVWLAEEVRKSSLLGRFPVRVIPYGLDTELFRPREPAAERAQLGLQPDSPVMLFIASSLDDPRKGFQYLLEALPLVQAESPAVQFVAIGETGPQMAWPAAVKILPPSSSEEDMARVYACADLLVVPSLADNLPNVILEALACGVSAVGFAVGGISEVVRDGKTGVLVHERTGRALASAVCRVLKEVLSNPEIWRQRCREVAAREFSLETQAGRYVSLYEGLLRN